MNPQFSIVIPHYDIPDLLMRCLDSIPIREDIQVVVVDDNSPDAETYIDRYPQLSRPFLEFVRTTKGGGAGYARNVGLERAKGKWLLFADADDFYVDNMHEMLLSRSKSEADIVFFRTKSVLFENTSCESGQDGYLNDITDIFLNTGDEWPIRTRFYVPWGKMIRRDLVVRHNIRFDEVKYSNDCFFSVCAGFNATTIEVADQVLYIKTARPGSLMANHLKTAEDVRIRADVYFRIEKFLLQHDMCRNRVFPEYMILLLRFDRVQYRYYFYHRILELYPSRWDAINHFRKGHSFKAQAVIVLYSLLIWGLGGISGAIKNKAEELE